MVSQEGASRDLNSEFVSNLANFEVIEVSVSPSVNDNLMRLVWRGLCACLLFFTSNRAV